MCNLLFSGDLGSIHLVASELKDPICHSDECQIGSFSSEATIYFLCFLDNCINISPINPRWPPFHLFMKTNVSSQIRYNLLFLGDFGSTNLFIVSSK